MTVLETIGWVSAALAGISLGLLGGGGSILTVPILVYFFGFSGVAATGSSLLIVGSGALAGSLGPLFKGELPWKKAFLFAVPSATTVFVTRRFILPAVPDQVGPITKDSLVLVAFGILMLAVSFLMIKKRRGEPKPASEAPWLVPLVGIGVGLLAGFVGAGGGFLIVPALVLLLGIDMRAAVPTSLLIIAFQSLVGYVGSLSAQGDSRQTVVFGLALIAVAGVFVGARLKGRFQPDSLRRGFGWFVLIVGIAMTAKELLLGPS